MITLGSTRLRVHLGCPTDDPEKSFCRGVHVATIPTTVKETPRKTEAIASTSAERHDKARAREIKSLKRSLAANPYESSGRDRAEERRFVASAALADGGRKRTGGVYRGGANMSVQAQDSTGLDMMKKMGYTPGSGLGANKDGRLDIIPTTMRAGKTGLGASGAGNRKK